MKNKLAKHSSINFIAPTNLSLSAQPNTVNTPRPHTKPTPAHTHARTHRALSLSFSLRFYTQASTVKESKTAQKWGACAHIQGWASFVCLATGV